jgi:signal transduction histidine kinase
LKVSEPIIQHGSSDAGGAVQPSGRTWPLSWHLAVLIAGALVPLVAFTGFIIVREADASGHEIKRRLLLAAKTMNADLDHEIQVTHRMLEAMARSHHLSVGEYIIFSTEAAEVVATQPDWLCLLVWGPDRRLLADSRLPGQIPTAQATEPRSLDRVLELRKPVVGWLARGGAGEGQWAFPVRVPVVKDGEIQAVLTAVIRAKALERLVSSSTPPSEWTRAIVDAAGTVVARTRDPERFVGIRATPSFVSQTMGTAAEGIYPDVTLEGQHVYVAFARSSLTGWVTAVTAQRDYVDGPVQRTLAAAATFGAGVILVSFLASWLVARRVAGDIAQSARDALALARGGTPRGSPSSVREVAILNSALQRSGNLLAESARQRDEHLAKLLELNQTLEQRVQHRTALAEQRATQLQALASELTQAEQRERSRVAHILHEHFQQMLVAARMQLASLRDRSRRAGIDAEIERVLELLRRTIHESRSLAVELSPPVLDSLGLCAGLTWLARSMQERYELMVSLSLDEAVDPVPHDTRMMLFHAARELLFNVVKHAAVTQAKLELSRGSGLIRLVVEDSGRGIEVKTAQVDGKPGGFGLFSLRERMQLVGGILSITSAHGQGTRVTLEVPISTPATHASSEAAHI